MFISKGNNDEVTHGDLFLFAFLKKQAGYLCLPRFPTFLQKNICIENIVR